jgi:hypothetical protein
MKTLPPYFNTLVFLASSGARCESLVAQALARSVWRLPLAEAAEQRVRLFPEVNCGWFWIRSNDAQHAQEISEAVEDQYAVCAYGDVCGSRTNSAARLILNAWAEGGVAKVLELNGNFGAVVLDRRAGAVSLVSDIIGQRTLHYWVGDSTFVASPHDVALVATGLVPPDFDYESAASIAEVGWSIRGKSLIQNVGNEPGGDYVRWHKGNIRRTHYVYLDRDARIAPRDDKSIKSNFDELICSARKNVRMIGQEHSTIHTDLTAGQDSRAVLGLLLSELPPSQIVAVTGGKDQSLDVRVAARIAKIYKVKHLIDEAETFHVGLEAFKTSVDALAFGMNGNVSAKYAATFFPQLSRDSPHVTGMGGEVFRGFYYQNLSLETKMPLKGRDILPLCDGQASYFLWLDSYYSNSVRERIVARLKELAEQAESWYDVLDLFYLTEAHGVWASPSSRTYLGARCFTPLVDPSMVRLAYKMPSPIGYHATYTHECIRRFMPKAYWVRVNGERLLPFDQTGLLNLKLFHIDKLANRILKKVSGSNNHTEPKLKDSTPEEASASAFAGPFLEYIRELLTERRSLTLEILGREYTEQILEEHASGVDGYCNLLGALVTIEHYRKLIEEAAR